MKKNKANSNAFEISARKVLSQDAEVYADIEGFDPSSVSASELTAMLIKQNKGMNVSDAIMHQFAIRSMFCGDVGAASFIRDTAGEKPKIKAEIDNSLNVKFQMKLVDANETQALAEKNPLELASEDISESEDGQEEDS